MALSGLSVLLSVLVLVWVTHPPLLSVRAVLLFGFEPEAVEVRVGDCLRVEVLAGREVDEAIGVGVGVAVEDLGATNEPNPEIADRERKRERATEEENDQSGQRRSTLESGMKNDHPKRVSDI